MDIEAKLLERIKRFEDIKNQIAEVSKKIGGLTEQQRALYNQGLELKGQIDSLLEMKADIAKEAEAAKQSLILPDKSLVASDGKTVIASPEAAAPVAEGAPVVEAPKAEVAPAKEPITLEVK